MTTYTNLKNQISRINHPNDLIDAHIATCQAYSAYKISHEQFTELSADMRAKRLEKKIAWGASI